MARALERCGMLLMEKDARGSHRKNDGSVISSREDAAREAGLSERQSNNAVRIASIDKELLDDLVEGERPPTVTELAEIGTKKCAVKPHDTSNWLPAPDGDFNPTMRFYGLWTPLINGSYRLPGGTEDRATGDGAFGKLTISQISVL